MFSRAAIKRFNDVSEVTPSPLDYDPKLPEHKAGVAEQRAERFAKDADKDNMPGQQTVNLDTIIESHGE